MTEAAVSLTTPIADAAILSLHSGDSVLLNGVIVTARDRAHQWLYERFIRQSVAPTLDDLIVYDALKPYLNNGLIYHCGPIVAELPDGSYQFIAAGPTTSIREEPYQAEIIQHFNLKGVIGKGGMGTATLQACAQTPAVYFHAVGGAAALIAQSVIEVLDVYKLEFGMPEAMWVIRVENFPAVVTMDAHNRSLHEQILTRSKWNLENLLG
ncbi:FumA C-terminus/TtdB family hydratase beta subunit [Pelolinea submarina]|uniref:Fumarate hydratase class I n=1 Tax=Pelolinea submarina TaxID=913107 RepID=A0A347ZQN6_9CHLR|nr:FumA C-terminus/TtdB family hydratase beta subunit [Pelolinea submarina]REG11827.1 fumarate hydratase class I [Pelolinea submarina]BBB47617.1 fumarate hydratase, class I [Pelolinea submarina]